ncbi:MAG: hypothetical protein NC420_01410 [Eubacterium sp.]|nr:hypothetical protein [Eubacterium sp.]MCM1213922.1 hypothetical protein [Lachnospiraceae bacterium]MCM1240182.1 hypothetical protein [Lachnospiraceae bacterium]MCM1304091.1 hypothetical protein [Butyrivibrio sp.]MCM1343603.1 hypothetical protein [Muribaculaceae bacterium]
MLQQKPMYTPTEKETGKEKLQDILNILPTVLLVVGILGMLISIDRFAIAVKPAIDFDGLMDRYAVPGDHVAGRVLYTYGCFAESSVIYAENGKKTGETKNGYYYAVPSVNGVMILEVPLRYHSAMETLTEQTFEYLYGGAEPQANAWINGYVVKNDSESLQRMLQEYLVALGYSGQEIADMGEVSIIKQDDMLTQLRNIFLGCSLALAAGLILLLIRKKEKIAVFFGKNRKNLSPEQEARLGHMLTQIFVDRKVILKQVAGFMTVGLVLASLVCYYKSSQGYLTGSVILAYVAAVLFGLFPLTGSRDYIIFYEHGMNHCGESFLYEESGYPEFQLIPQKNGKVTVFLKLKHRIFNVSNMEDFIARYKRAYGIQ